MQDLMRMCEADLLMLRFLPDLDDGDGAASSVLAFVALALRLLDYTSITTNHLSHVSSTSVDSVNTGGFIEVASSQSVAFEGLLDGLSSDMASSVRPQARRAASGAWNRFKQMPQDPLDHYGLPSKGEMRYARSKPHFSLSSY